MKFIISQILGAIGYFLLAFSYFKKEKREILFIQIIAYIGFTTHYILLEAVTGTACNVLGFIALILIYFFSKDEKKKKILVLILIPLLILMSFLSYENIFSLFPVIACLLTFNSFLSKEESKIRFIGIISAVCWLIYAIIHGSYSAIIFEVVTVVATTIAYVKYKKVNAS
ncbi:MAG: YgjV family protein [Bacilli bacterium]|nr:YgjV family protein [Bacilli bacterium]